MFRVFSWWLVVFLVAGCMDQRSVPAATIDATAWSNTSEKDRYALAVALVNSNLLHGKRSGDVIALLGPPSTRNDAEHYVTYVVKTGGRGFDQVKVLDIHFAPSRGTVDRVAIRGD